MIPKIRSILYCTDLSKNSAYAFRYAINTAQKHDADIYILYVIEEIPEYFKTMLERYANNKRLHEAEKQRKGESIDRIKKRLEEVCRRELANEPESLKDVKKIEVCEGYPAEEILKKADEFDCDIIIMGTHSKGAVSHTFLGSVAQRVLRHVRKPVFIIPLPEGETDISLKDM